MVHSGTRNTSHVPQTQEFLLLLINLHLLRIQTQNHLKLQRETKVVRVVLLQELFLLYLKEKMVMSRRYIYLGKEVIVKLKLMNEL